MTGSNGEFMAAAFIWQELGIASGPYDVQMLAQVIAYAARDSKTDAETVSKALLKSAQAAVARGERVNTFWFKDRKFAENGTSQPRSDPRYAQDDETRAVDEHNTESTRKWAIAHGYDPDTGRKATQ